MEVNSIIRFDWAAKRILRQKANFGVLEGLVTVLLGEPVHIVELLESESNQEDATDKFNRVDIKAKNSKDEIIIVEIQLMNNFRDITRILYGNESLVLNGIVNGRNLRRDKVAYIGINWSSNEVLHQYIYRGYRSNLSYSLLFPSLFSGNATTPLEEWLDYLKNNHIKEDTTAPGLQEARNMLASGMDDAVVMRLTGLTSSELQDLK